MRYHGELRRTISSLEFFELSGSALLTTNSVGSGFVYNFVRLCTHRDCLFLICLCFAETDGHVSVRVWLHRVCLCLVCFDAMLDTRMAVVLGDKR